MSRVWHTPVTIKIISGFRFEALDGLAARSLHFIRPSHIRGKPGPNATFTRRFITSFHALE